ncbi:MAG TPA: RICIN domain-containing protein [Polyangiaceae bacterium]
MRPRSATSSSFAAIALLFLALLAGCGSSGSPTESAADGSAAASPDGAASPAGDGAAGAPEAGLDATSPDAAALGDAAPLTDAGPAPQPSGTHFLDAGALLGAADDPGWYLENIPFLELPDSEIQSVYYYRWQTYREHLVYTGPEYGYLASEFLAPVSYGAPYGGVVAAAGHHITEGRWLRTARYVEDDVRYWLSGPGQFAKPQTDAVNADTSDWAHEYSFWAASAVWSDYLVTGNRAFAIGEEPALIRQYQGWANHFDGALGLYWQVPVWDATEYSASSYESSDPYHGGAGFRPTINAYQFGDARAIAAIASLAGDSATASTYQGLAASLQSNMQAHLWDPARAFFYDLPRDGNPSQTLLDTREEMGFVPWMFEMPAAGDATAFAALVDPQGFAAPYGPTTIERRSALFMKDAAGCCHWDGPSWPYETSQTLTGLANLLDDYPAQTVIGPADYLSLLHAYAVTQTKNGAPYVAEAHDPDQPTWIYDSANHSEDYNHSTFVDNVLTGLLGLRPQPDDTLRVQPLAPATWDYFAVENALYHGHELSVLWDRTGTRYGQGAGLRVYVDGQVSAVQAGLTALTVPVGPALARPSRLDGVDVAANSQRFAYGPQASATYTSPVDNAWNVVDGILYRTGIPENSRWTSFGSPNASDSFTIDFQRPVTFDYVRLHFYDDGGGVRAPASFELQALLQGVWTSIPGQSRAPAQPVGNARNELSFPPVTTNQLRVVAPNAGAGVGWGIGELWVRSKPVFQVVNVNSGLLLAVQNASQADGAQVQQFHDSGTPDHLWEVVSNADGSVTVVNVNSGLVLAIAGASTAASALVVQTFDAAAASARWFLQDRGNGQYAILNANSHLLLGVDGESKSDSANVVQFGDNGTADHLWMLEPASDPEWSYDDFEDASTAAWSVAAGAWSVCTPASREYCAAGPGEGVVLTGDSAWRDYTVDALVRVDGSASAAVAELLVRAADGSHYYAAGLTHRTDGTRGWEIARNDGGVRTVLASGAYAWDATGQTAVRFAAVGGTLTLGVLRPSGAVDTLGEVFDVRFAGGKAGLRANGVAASFDAVRVTAG